MTKTLALWLAALCLAELVHNVIEIWGMRQKVAWLDASLAGRRHGRWPIDVNTSLKVVALHAAIVLVVATASAVLLTVLNLSVIGLLVLGVAALLVNFVITTWLVDRWHTEIGRLIKAAKRGGTRRT